MSGLSGAGSTRAWRRLRALVLDRDQRRCQLLLPNGQLCGAYANHVDHRLPRKRGGQDELWNLRAACASCNMRRGANPGPNDVPRAPDHVRRSWAW